MQTLVSSVVFNRLLLAKYTLVISLLLELSRKFWSAENFGPGTKISGKLVRRTIIF